MVSIAVREYPSAAVGILARLSHYRWFRRLVVWGALVALYEAAAYAVGPFFLPTVQATVRGGIDLVRDGSINTLWPALLDLALGFGIAVAIGLPVGVAMGGSRLVEYVLGVYTRALFVTPLIAVLPVVGIILGYDLTFRVTVVVLFAIFFIILQTSAGVRDVNPQLVDAARCFGVPRLQRAWKVTLPSALPFIVSGLRLGLANAYGGMILGELWVARPGGLGEVLKGLGYNRNLPKFVAWLVLVTLLASLSAEILKAIERRLSWGREGQRLPQTRERKAATNAN